MKKYKRQIIIGTIIVLILGYWWYSRSKSSSKEIQYVTETAKRGMLTSSISVSGNIIVDDQATVDPTITGTVAGLAVKIGDSVKKGQLLFILINDQLGIDATRSQVSYIQAQQSLENAKANKKQADYDLDHATGGLKQKAILKNKYEASKIALKAAEQSLQVAQASYQNSLADAAKRRVVAPMDAVR